MKKLLIGLTLALSASSVVLAAEETTLDKDNLQYYTSSPHAWTSIHKTGPFDKMFDNIITNQTGEVVNVRIDVAPNSPALSVYCNGYIHTVPAGNQTRCNVTNGEQNGNGLMWGVGLTEAANAKASGTFTVIKISE